MSAGAAAGSPAFAALRRRRRAMPTATAASAAATTPAAAAGCARLGVAVAAAASLSDASDATLAAASLSICLAACCSAYFAATNEAAEAEASPTVAFSENWMEANLSAVALEDAWYACPSFWKSKLGSVKKRKPVSSPCAANPAPVSAPVCANGIQPTFSAGASAAGASDAAPSSMRQLFVVEERPAAALVAAATAFALPAAEMSETIATAESTATAALSSNDSAALARSAISALSLTTPEEMAWRAYAFTTESTSFASPSKAPAPSMPPPACSYAAFSRLIAASCASVVRESVVATPCVAAAVWEPALLCASAAAASVAAAVEAGVTSAASAAACASTRLTCPPSVSSQAAKSASALVIAVVVCTEALLDAAQKCAAASLNLPSERSAVTSLLALFDAAESARS
mmetsp:Transcript_32167/g.94816  ORF Transcript_32167/g.94816 Transcript_32167/m.94816 type:complete len:405 (-) Transcript_32167:157-1371(-)